MNPIGTERTPLFDALPTNGTATSAAAAHRAMSKCDRDRETIYAVIVAGSLDHRGATAKEIAAATGLSGDTIRPRIRELEGWSPRNRPPRPVRIAKSAVVVDGYTAYVTIEEARRAA